MDLQTKLHILADAAKYDTACASSRSERKRTDARGIGNAAPGGICHSFTPDGRCVSLLKILLTNYCVYDCRYCVNRISSDTPRARFTVEEVVKLTMDFYKRNYIEGLFLSSGIIQNSDYTMEQLIAVGRKLREEERFSGYIHLKAVPGAAQALLAEAGKWADRLSVNVELPLQQDLDQLAPAKKLTTIETSMAQIRAATLEAPKGFLPAGQTTQMMVGATAATDAQLLQRASSLYQVHKLKRVYYSAFSPIPHASSELPLNPPPLIREHRLYQADWLMRYYGFRAEELYEDSQHLSMRQDPKLAWALRHREFFPVDVNRSPRSALLRVPGMGVRNVDRILTLRRLRQLSMSDLRKLNVAVERARPFVVTTDSLPKELDSSGLPNRFESPVRQMTLFEAQASAISGQL